MLADKRILVTGADGFVGSNLCHSFIKRNIKLTAFVRKSSTHKLINISDLKKEIKISYGDLRDFDTINNAVKDIDVVYHLGAQSHVPDSVREPFSTFKVNALGTLNCLEAARKNDVEFFINAGSDKIYGDPVYLPIDEKHPIRPRSPYDASKVAGEALCLSYFKTYGIKVFLPRFSNIYGPRQDSRKVIPDFIFYLLQDKQPVIRSDGTPIRDYLYIEDAVEAYSRIVEFPSAIGEILNFGTGVGTSVSELCEMIIEISGKKVKPVILGEISTSEIQEQVLEISKARKILNWLPKITLYEGLSSTWKWYKEHIEYIL